MRCVIARGLPVPAPASTQTGPRQASANSSCSGSRAASRSSGSIGLTLPETGRRSAGGLCQNFGGELGGARREATEVHIELDPAAAEFVMSVNGGNQTVPTLLFGDGSTMCNPSAAQVQKKLAQLASATS